jgi:hypothetical protein
VRLIPSAVRVTTGGGCPAAEPQLPTNAVRETDLTTFTAGFSVARNAGLLSVSGRADEGNELSSSHWAGFGGVAGLLLVTDCAHHRLRQLSQLRQASLPLSAAFNLLPTPQQSLSTPSGLCSPVRPSFAYPRFITPQERGNLIAGDDPDRTGDER